MNLNEKKLLDKKNKEKTNVNQAGPWDFYLLIILPGIMEKLKAIQRRKLFVLKIDMNITISFPQKKLRISPYTWL